MNSNFQRKKVLKNLNHNKATKYTYLSRDPDNNLCPELFRHKQVTVLWWFLSETSNCPPFSTSQTLTYRPPVRRKHTKQFDIHTHLHFSAEVFTQWYSASFITQSSVPTHHPHPLWLSPGTRHITSLLFFRLFCRHSWMTLLTKKKKKNLDTTGIQDFWWNGKKTLKNLVMIKKKIVSSFQNFLITFMPSL